MMTTKRIADKICDKISEVNSAYKTSLRRFKDGDFGDLEEIEFRSGGVLGRIALWSNGFIFYNMIDLNSNAFEIFEETFFDSTGMADEEILSELSRLFTEMAS